MPKVKPFGIGDVDDLVDAKNEFSNEVVPKGIYKAKVKRVTMGTIQKAGENKGKTRFAILLEVVGGAGKKKIPDKYVGAGVWTGINVIKSGAGFCNDFVNALAGPDEAAQKLLRRSFWKPDIVVDNEGNVKRIGKKKVNSPDGEILVTIKTKMGKDGNGDPRAEVQSFLFPKGSEDDDLDDEDEDDIDEDDDDDDDALSDVEDDEDDEDEDDEDDEDDEEDEEEDDDEDEDDDEEDEEDEEEDDSEARKAELESLTLTKLRPIAKELGIDTKGLDKVALITSILEEEAAGSDEEDDEDEDDEDEAELRKELDGLSEIALRKRAKEAGLKLAQYKKGTPKTDVIDAIVEAELEDEDEEDDEDEDVF